MKSKESKLKRRLRQRLKELGQKVQSQIESTKSKESNLATQRNLRDDAEALAARFPKDGVILTSLSFRWISGIWALALISVAIDPFLRLLPIEFVLDSRSVQFVKLALYFVLGFSVVGIFRGEILSFFERNSFSKETIIKGIKSLTVEKIVIAIVATVAVVGSLVYFYRHLLPSLAPILTFLVAAAASLASAFRGLSQQGEFYERLKSDRAFAILVKDQQVFMTHLVAILTARSISLIAAVLCGIQEIEDFSFYLYLGLTVLLLLAFRPEQSDFIVNCPRCAKTAPRGAKALGFCVDCESSVRPNRP